MDEAGDVELFEGDFSAFFHFCLVFSVFGVLDFVGCADTARFKLDFGAENPFGVELIVEGEDETGDADGVAVVFLVAV